MPRWPDIATWRGPSPNTSGTITDHMYVVVHTAAGSYDGTIAWQKNRASSVSSHFVVAKDGRITQMLDTNAKPWTQIDGNPYSISIENEGDEHTPLTPQQIEANARILAKAHQVHGVPLQLTGHVGTRGLGHHSMGAESGVDWGHPGCPGGIIKAQKGAILARAVAIVGGAPAPTPALHLQEPTMIFTVTGVPAGATDVTGVAVPNNGQCLATPAGPYNLTGTEFYSLPKEAQPNRITMPWGRLLALCAALKQPAVVTDAQITAIADKLIASNANGLTAADHAGVLADVKAALNTAHLTTS